MWSIIIYFLILSSLIRFNSSYSPLPKEIEKRIILILIFSHLTSDLKCNYHTDQIDRLTTFGVERYYSSYQILDSMFMIPSPIEMDSLTPDRYHRPPGQQWWSVDPDHRGTLNTRQRGTRSSFSGGVGLRQASANDLPETAQESRW